MLREGENGNRISSGCAISGIFSKDGKVTNGEKIIRSIGLMRERSNGLGGGFAAYGIYPDYSELYAFHVFYDSLSAKDECEDALKESFDIEKMSEMPTRKHPAIKNEPLIYRYFVFPKKECLEKADEKQFVVSFVMKINTYVSGAYIFSCGKNMGAFKAVGYPEDVGEYFRLEDYNAYCWTAHGRYPTNTPGWWAGAHPFCLLDMSVVHNGEISSYDANRRYMEMFGYKCNLLTDTEVIAYIADYLLRVKKLTLKEFAGVIAAPFWSTIEHMPKEAGEQAAYLRYAFPSLLLTGPFSIILGFSGGIMALNDRLKLRSMVVGEKDDMVYVASEESAIRLIEPQLDRLWAPTGGEAVIFTLNEREK